MISYHVVVLDAVEFSFKLPDFSAVCVHLIARARPVFVELVDDQCRIPIHHEAFDTELDGYMESVETCFVFGDVIGGWKMNSENVLELVLSRRNE